MKLAIITTHPIQYNAPFFKLLTERGKVALKVFYTWSQAIEGFDDPDFGSTVKWDIPLLEGYDWEAVENVSKSPSSKSWKGIDCPSLIKKVEACHPDAVMVYGWNLKSHFNAMRYFKGKIPVWFFGDSTLLDEKPGIKKVLRRLWLTWVYRHVDKAFYVGANNKAYFEAHGLKQEQLVFSPHAIDNERFFDSDKNQYESKAKAWRGDLGYKDDDIVVEFAGKFEPRKNLRILIEAVIQLNEKKDHSTNSIENPSIFLLLVGNGPLEQLLCQMAKGKHYIKFLAFQNQSEMPIVYRIGNIFCLPSKSETWGLAVNEVMACGRPVVLSDKVGCAIDLLVNGLNGAIFNTLHVEDCAEKIMKLATHKDKLKRESIMNSIGDWSFERKCRAIEDTIERLKQN
jgi:glycosyltransferase involved in cell wall biosynthesis